MDKEFISKALSAYQKYKGDKETLNYRVRENELWYKARYGKIITKHDNTEPATALIFSAVENKYADAIDNYPQPNILEREPSDCDLSEILSKIVPAQMELSKFKAAYKANWRRKLKHGTGIYGVFYDEDDIKIKPLSMLNIYCDMHIQDVQDSQFLFIVSILDNEKLKEDYPKFATQFNGSASIDTFDGTYELKDRSEIIDCYYKKSGAVHCMKLCKNEVISATEDMKEYKDGLYRHGLYPVVFDVLYPEEDCPFGFGIIDIAKNPQLYIDRLDGAIVKNSVLSSKTRFMIKDNGAINEDEVIDCDNDIIHVSGNVDGDSIRELQTSTVPQTVMNYRSSKIDELKEIIGNRDFQQGGTNNGVTAASAITALQEAGNKLSRAAIDDSYDAYKQVVVMCIELMREFYSDDRVYRITGDDGKTQYENFNSSMMYSQSGQPDDDVLNSILPDTWRQGDPIEFDIEVVPQKQNPFQRESNNQTIMTLWSAGMFNPQTVDVSIIALSAMSFDGRDKIIQDLRKMQQTNAQVASGQLVPIKQGIEQAAIEEQVQSSQSTDDPLVSVEDTLNELERSGNNGDNSRQPAEQSE